MEKPGDSLIPNRQDVLQNNAEATASRQPNGSSRDWSSAVQSTENLVIEASSEFLKQIESTREKYVSEIGKLKDEMQELRMEKQSFQDDRNRAESNAAEAELQMNQVAFGSAFGYIHYIHSTGHRFVCLIFVRLSTTGLGHQLFEVLSSTFLWKNFWLSTDLLHGSAQSTCD